MVATGGLSIPTLGASGFYGRLGHHPAGKLQIWAEKGRDLSHLIEETLRDKIPPTLSVAPQPAFRLTTVGGEGVRPGVDLNNSAALLALMEQGA